MCYYPPQKFWQAIPHTTAVLKYKICPMNELYSNVSALQCLQYLYICPMHFNPIGSSSGTQVTPAALTVVHMLHAVI